MLFLIISIICSLYLLLTSLSSILGIIGIAFPNLLSFIPGMWGLVGLMLSVLWLSIDGFGEEHLAKKLSLGAAALLTLYFAYLALSMLGVISFALPAALGILIQLLYFAGGILLVAGIFMHHLH